MQKKIPTWPLYAADALMFLAVLLISLPNVAREEPMQAWQAASLAALVAAAMALVALPLALQYRAQVRIAQIGAMRDGEQAREQAAAASADLRALRSSLAEQADAIRAARGAMQGLGAELAAEKSRSQETAKNLFASQEGMSQMCARLDALEGKNPEIEALRREFDAFRAEASSQDPDALRAEVADLKEKIESLISEIRSAMGGDGRAADVEGRVEAPENADLPEPAAAGAAGGAHPEEAEAPGESPETEPGAGGESENAAPSKPLPNWSGMIEKALSNSQAFSTRSVVSRFIEKNRTGDAPAEYDGVESPVCLKQGTCAPGDASSPETADELDASETMREVSPGVEKYVEELEGAKGQAALFPSGEIPETKKPRPARPGDTAVSANAFLGIGNRPFLRGDGGGLDPSKGSPMQMLEIGRWQWVCPEPPSAPIRFTIWLNDETPSNLGEMTLNPGETLELDPDFKSDA